MGHPTMQENDTAKLTPMHTALRRTIRFQSREELSKIFHLPIFHRLRCRVRYFFMSVKLPKLHIP